MDKLIQHYLGEETLWQRGEKIGKTHFVFAHFAGIAHILGSVAFGY